MLPEPSKPVAFMIAVALVAVVAWIDDATGAEISVTFLYLAPLLWAAWTLSLPLGLWLSAIAAATHTISAWLSGVEYSQIWITWQRGVAMWLFFAFVVYSLHTFRRGRKVDREQIQHLKELLRVCPVCNRTNHPDGQWRDVDRCSHEPEGKSSGKRLCPDCASARESVEFPSA